MKPRFSSALLVILSVLGIAHSSGEDSGANCVVKATKNNALIEVSVPAVTNQGEGVVMVFKLTNKGKQVLYYTVPSPPSGLGVTILDSKKIEVPLTELGNKAFLRFGHDDFDYLEPGKSLEYKISLNDYFKLVPGKYSISVAMDLGTPLAGVRKFDITHSKGFELTVEGVAFEIK